MSMGLSFCLFFFQAEDGIRDIGVTGVQTCALPISNLERVRGLLRERRDAMLEALERELGGRARWSRPEGGYFLWLELPEGTDATELLGRASEAGVTFVPGSDFGGEPNSARLAFSFASPAEIDEGVSRLAGLVPATTPTARLSRINQICATFAVKTTKCRCTFLWFSMMKAIA